MNGVPGATEVRVSRVLEVLVEGVPVRLRVTTSALSWRCWRVVSRAGDLRRAPLRRAPGKTLAPSGANTLQGYGGSSVRAARVMSATCPIAPHRGRRGP